MKSKLVNLISYFISNNNVTKKERWRLFLGDIYEDSAAWSNFDMEMKLN